MESINRIFEWVFADIKELVDLRLDAIQNVFRDAVLRKTVISGIIKVKH